MRKFTKFFGIYLSIIFISFLLLEILLIPFVQLQSPYHLNNPRLIQDQRNFWINIPNSRDLFNNNIDFKNSKLNILSNGLRFTYCNNKKFNNKNINIFLVGDSQLFGWGLDDRDTISSKLSCKLNKEKYKYNTFNMGVWGTNIDQYYMRLSMIKDAMKYEDKYFFLITWNDWHSFAEIHVEPSTQCSNYDHSIYFLVSCINKNSRTYGVQSDFRKEIYTKTNFFIPVFSDLKTFLNTVQYSSRVFHVLIPIIKNIYLKNRNYNFGNFTKNESIKNGLILNKISNYIGSEKDIYFLFLPSRISYVNNVYKVYSQKGKVYPDQDFLFYYAKKECKKFKLNCLSLYEYLKTDELGEYDFKFDGHLNAKGAEIISSLIYEMIFESN